MRHRIGLVWIATIAAMIFAASPASATCGVTVPMLQAINCSEYPPSLVSFCARYKPYLMGMSACNAAESAALGRDFGPRRQECTRQSFDLGTGSWSYVWACSWLEAEEEEPEEDDPECYARLRELGLQFSERGDVRMGFDPVTGSQCIIRNAVSTRGGSISYGGSILAACPLVEALERYGTAVQAAAAQVGEGGVVGIANLGVFNCRAVRNANGIGSSLSRHATGEAIDVSAYVLSSGRQIPISDWDKGSEENKRFLRAAHQAACSSFRGVLGPEFYNRQYYHFHLEVGGGSFCRK